MSGHRFEFHNVPHNLKQLVLLQSTQMSYIELTHLRGSFILAQKWHRFQIRCNLMFTLSSDIDLRKQFTFADSKPVADARFPGEVRHLSRAVR